MHGCLISEEVLVAMYDEDQETLAAEYVLGTLSSEERQHAEALRSFDAKFESSVQQWERRLGELNVMVEAVEPSPAVWDKVKTQIEPVEADRSKSAPPDRPPPLSAVAALASDLPAETDGDKSTTGAVASSTAAAEAPAKPRKIESNANIVVLSRRARRWRRVSLAVGALAAVLALYIAAWQVAPDLMPPQLRPRQGDMVARSETAPRTQQDRLVAVLQQGPNAPAFLLTFDMQRRTLFIRKVSATAEAGKSYELWLISKNLGAPRSLGVIGNDEFTSRNLGGNYDADTLRAATYAVSLEPNGGSPTGAPTGPVLFTGRAVESLPASPPKT
jgi:anti-sigma-K factor RskA